MQLSFAISRCVYKLLLSSFRSSLMKAQNIIRETGLII